MLDLEKHAAALARLHVAADRIAEGVRREMGGELARQSIMLAADLAAMARNVESSVAHFREEMKRLRYYETPAADRARCQTCKAILGVDGICEQCEGIRG